ncbi:MAG: bacterioferritin-associated ferredoxin [Phycisphaerales bacterium]|nr:hypothetical protein [Phycisphaerales bacterium]
MGHDSKSKASIADLDRPSSRVRVERCVCFNQSFEKLLEMSRQEDLSLEQLSDRTGCCTGCGMCKQYVRVVLSTGRTSIPLMNGRALREIAEEAESAVNRQSSPQGVTAKSFESSEPRVGSRSVNGSGPSQGS